jgi:hypothetical protein
MSCFDLFQEFQKSTNTKFSHQLSINLDNQKVIYYCKFNNNEVFDNNIKNYYEVSDLINNDTKLFMTNINLINSINTYNKTVITSTSITVEKKS